MSIQALELSGAGGGLTAAFCGIPRGQHPPFQLEGRGLQSIEIRLGPCLRLGTLQDIEQPFPCLLRQLLGPSGVGDPHAQFGQWIRGKLNSRPMVDGSATGSSKAEGEKA